MLGAGLKFLNICINPIDRDANADDIDLWLVCVLLIGKELFTFFPGLPLHVKYTYFPYFPPCGVYYYGRGVNTGHTVYQCVWLRTNKEAHPAIIWCVGEHAMHQGKATRGDNFASWRTDRKCSRACAHLDPST